jgi:hypothetical protein
MGLTLSKVARVLKVRALGGTVSDDLEPDVKENVWCSCSTRLMISNKELS